MEASNILRLERYQHRRRLHKLCQLKTGGTSHWISDNSQEKPSKQLGQTHRSSRRSSVSPRLAQALLAGMCQVSTWLVTPGDSTLARIMFGTRGRTAGKVSGKKNPDVDADAVLLLHRISRISPR